MQRNKTPSWIVKKYLSKITNKYAYYIQSEDIKPEISAPYTWASRCDKAKAKLHYRFNNVKTNMQEDSDWTKVIASIRKRLKQLYDDECSWRYTEYSIVEKMNKQEFFRIDAPNLLWHHTAVNKAGRANKLINRHPIIKIRTNKYDWADVIGNSKIKISSYQLIDKFGQDELWKLCFSANLEKIRMRFRWLDWKSCINKNYKKLKYLGYEDLLFFM